MREYLFVFLVALATTYVLVPLMRTIAVRVGAFTEVRERDVHVVPIPRLGGVAMFFGYAAATLAASRMPFLRQVFETGELIGILVGAAVVCLVGAIDDVKELDALTKLGGQLVAAAIIAFAGVQFFSLPLGTVTVLPAPLLVLLTIFVVVLCINAVNFIDGLDGLAAGLVAIAAGAFFIYSYLISGSYDPPNVFSSATFVSAALAGCCLGFLPHNVFPAKLFMGDSGALLLGLLLAAATISNVGQINPDQVSANALAATVLPLLIPISIMLLPLLDVVWAVARRTARGQRPWDADSQHLHHRMLQIGHGHRRAVLLLWLWAAVVALGAVSLVFLPLLVAGIGGVVMLVVAAVLTIWLPRFSRPGHRPKTYDTQGQRLDV
ncbi:undecaprenyl/decaprenyl-phosphate alpha-N-acetylglucosaminyl 1-phosphate transferase [Janibacter sp. CX7]|uniref:glycosyltransferase family 4 protein n=1 Tax=Janibacter sp. CX7 TaxID=2963431 RepID=UPI0020CD3BAE|nr:MraY family glycosyltransferase [Janibacter sp. CX7]UTT66920.1 undecaprenyl/decaprenyl-phosphate alpha-N-acetylglucosaminyl 1-phosphate transferase [Janibacter sp. CX7]